MQEGIAKAWDLHERIYEARRVMNNLTAELYALDGVAPAAPIEDHLDAWASRIQVALDAVPDDVMPPAVELLDAGQALWDINLASREIRRLREELANAKA